MKNRFLPLLTTLIATAWVSFPFENQTQAVPAEEYSSTEISWPRPLTLSTVTVRAREGWLKEEAWIGETQRPEWTSRRRFSTTRSYIQYEPGEIATETWWRNRSSRGKSPKQLFMHEIAVGLPNRMQLDVYYDWAYENRNALNKDLAVELRWALADWDVIPLNPTLYAEYKITSASYGSDVWEAKLLLSDDITPRLHWALNAAFERETSGALHNEFSVTQGLSYTVVDQKFSAGVEMQFKHEHDTGFTSTERKFQVGPSLQYSPSPNCWLNVVALGGCTAQSPAFESFIVFGFNFGRGAAGRSLSRPTSAPR